MNRAARGAGSAYADWVTTDDLRRTAFRAVAARNFERAIVPLREVARREPDSSPNWQNVGAALLTSVVEGAEDADARVVEAKAALRRALRLDPYNSQALTAFATVVGFYGERLRAAERLIRRAIRVYPGSPPILLSLAGVLEHRGDLDGAIAAARGALRASHPGRPRTVAATLCRLLAVRGDHAAAWDALDDDLLHMPDYRPPWPLWGPWPDAPEPAPGRDVLALVAPEGYGDEIQFARYVHLAARAGWRVRLHCSRPVARLFRTLPGVARLVVAGQPEPSRAPDAMLPIGLLPYRFRTPPATIPPPAAIRSDPDDVRRWGARLAGPGAMNVGLVWGSTDRHRSLRLADLAPLGAVPGARFFGLQVGAHASQAVTPPPGMAFEDLSGEIGDFADLAAIMANLDLIVTADTAPAHVAGSLGRPTWVLLPTPPAWLFGLEGAATPWYPSMRLWRQATRGDWSGPVARAADELRHLAAERPDRVEQVVGGRA